MKHLPRVKLPQLSWVWWLLLCSLFFLFPLFAENYLVSLLTEMLIVGLWAVAFNVTFGYAGLLCLGHSAYYGIGAYTCALLLMKTSLPFAVCLLAAPVAAGLAAVIFGYFCLRLTHIYFALLSVAFGQVVYTVTFKWLSFTGGDTGLIGIRPPALLSTITNFYLFTLILVIVSFWILRTIMSSPFGHMLRAVRDNPERARFVGINVRTQLLACFVISGFFAGLAGGLYALFAQSITPNLMVWFKSAEPLLACILGGLYTFWGPAVGAALILGLNFSLTTFTQYWPMVMGSIIIIVVMAFDEGVMGFAENRFRPLAAKWRRKWKVVE